MIVFNFFTNAAVVSFPWKFRWCIFDFTLLNSMTFIKTKITSTRTTFPSLLVSFFKLPHLVGIWFLLWQKTQTSFSLSDFSVWSFLSNMLKFYQWKVLLLQLFPLQRWLECLKNAIHQNNQTGSKMKGRSFQKFSRKDLCWFLS